MNRNIDSMDDLAKTLLPSLKGMVDVMANRVYETLNFFLQKYYDSYEPKYYRRQYDFLRSAIKVDARIVRGKVVAAVYIDTASMDNYYEATGTQVATWANEGLHGGLNVGRNTPHVWDDTMVNLIKRRKMNFDYKETKICKKCGREFLLENYAINKISGYRRNVCKDCENESHREKRLQQKIINETKHILKIKQ